MPHQMRRIAGTARLWFICSLFTLLCGCLHPVAASVASTYQVFHRIGPNASLPNVSSTPIIEIANSLPLSGTYAGLGLAALQSITLWLQLANSRGGVDIQGQQHYFAYTYIDDGTSPGYVVDIYTYYTSSILSGQLNISVLFAPWSSTLTIPALQTVVQSGLNMTFFAIGAGSPSVYVNSAGTGPVYPYCYGTSILTNHQLDYPLTSVLTGLNIRTIVILYRPDSFATPIYTQMMAWVALHNITVIANVVVSSLPVDATSTGSWAKTLLNAVPDPTTVFDLLFLCTANAADLQAMAGGMAVTQHRPKMALFPNYFVDTDPMVVNLADQWTTTWPWNVDVNYTTTVPRYIFPSTAAFSQALYSAYGIPTQANHLQAVASMELLLSALSTTASLRATDMHAALLNISGYTVWNYHQFDPTFLYDVALQETLYQLRGGSDHRVVSPAALQYPATWPWLIQPQQGDSLPVSSSFSVLVLAVVLSVFGSWIALLLVEQLLVFRRASNRKYWFWLLLVAVAGGAGATWTSLITSFASLSFPCALCAVSTSVNYSVMALFLALLPAVLLMLLGHFLLSNGGRISLAVRDNQPTSTMRTSSVFVPSPSGSAMVQDKDSGTQTKRPVDFLKQLKALHPATIPGYLAYQSIRLWRRLNISFVMGALSITASLILTRVTLTYCLIGRIGWTSSPVAELCSILVAFVLVQLSMLAFYYATRFRVLGVLLYAVALQADFQLQLSLATISYQPHGLDTVGYVLSSLTLSSSVLVAVAALVGGLLGLVFIYLQFSEMKLSNHEIARSMARLRKQQKETELALDKERITNRCIQRYVLTANQVIAFTNLTRPIASSERSAYATLLTPAWCLACPLTLERSTLVQSAKEVESLLQAAATTAGQPKRNSVSIGKSVRDDDGRGNENALDELLRHPAVLNADTAAKLNELSLLTAAEYAYLSSHLQVSHFVAHPFTVEILKDELERQLCVESVFFLLHVQQWKLLYSSGASPSIVRSLASQLVQHFIREGAPQQVNLNAVLRSKIEKAVARGSTSDAALFQMAEREVQSLIETNNMKGFKAHPLYPACVHLLGYCSRTLSVITKPVADDSELLSSSELTAEPSRGSVTVGSRKGVGATSSSLRTHVNEKGSVNAIGTALKPQQARQSISELSVETTTGSEEIGTISQGTALKRQPASKGISSFSVPGGVSTMVVDGSLLTKTGGLGRQLSSSSWEQSRDAKGTTNPPSATNRCS